MPFVLLISRPHAVADVIASIANEPMLTDIVMVSMPRPRRPAKRC